ncbi:MAG: Tim44/TimA family putative adaptor protein [Robiginitomaculum sp.]
MQEIILYGVLALIVAAMLYSVLGKNVGHRSETAVSPQDFLDKFNKDARSEQPELDYEGPGQEGLLKIAKADSNFSLPLFIDGAKAAYGMILEAFADGDRDTLKNLLNEDVKTAYFAAIDAREEKQLSQTTDLARLISADIIAADRNGKTGKIKVVYTAELATALLNKSGEIVEGDLDVLSRVREEWSFERTLGSKNPNWILSGVAPHTIDGEADTGPDHSPDHDSSKTA